MPNISLWLTDESEETLALVLSDLVANADILPAPIEPFSDSLCLMHPASGPIRYVANLIVPPPSARRIAPGSSGHGDRSSKTNVSWMHVRHVDAIDPQDRENSLNLRIIVVETFPQCFLPIRHCLRGEVRIEIQPDAGEVEQKGTRNQRHLDGEPDVAAVDELRDVQIANLVDHEVPQAAVAVPLPSVGERFVVKLDGPRKDSSLVRDLPDATFSARAQDPAEAQVSGRGVSDRFAGDVFEIHDRESASASRPFGVRANELVLQRRPISGRGTIRARIRDLAGTRTLRKGGRGGGHPRNRRRWRRERVAGEAVGVFGNRGGEGPRGVAETRVFVTVEALRPIRTAGAAALHLCHTRAVPPQAGGSSPIRLDVWLHGVVRGRDGRGAMREQAMPACGGKGWGIQTVLRLDHCFNWTRHRQCCDK